MTLDEVNAIYHAGLRYARSELAAILQEEQKLPGAGERRHAAIINKNRLLDIVRDIDHPTLQPIEQ